MFMPSASPYAKCQIAPGWWDSLSPGHFLHCEMNRLVMMTHFLLLDCFSTFPAQKQGGKSDSDSSYALLLLRVPEVFPKRQSLSLWELSCFASFQDFFILLHGTAPQRAESHQIFPDRLVFIHLWLGQGWAQANDPKWDTNECCLGTEPYSCNLAASDPLKTGAWAEIGPVQKKWWKTVPAVMEWGVQMPGICLCLLFAAQWFISRTLDTDHTGQPLLRSWASDSRECRQTVCKGIKSTLSLNCCLSHLTKGIQYSKLLPADKFHTKWLYKAPMFIHEADVGWRAVWNDCG